MSEEIDPLGNSTTYAYDAAGRVESVTDQVLGAMTTFERDVAGRVTKTIDALTNETLASFKLGGRLQSTTDARGFTTTFARGPTVSSVTDPLMRTTTSTSSMYGLPQGTTYPDATGTSSDYLGTTRVDGSQGFPTTLTDELTRQRSFGYDAQSGLTSATDLAGQQWQYTYAASKGSAISYDVFSGQVGLGHHDGGARAYGGGPGGKASGFAHHLNSVTSPMGEAAQFVRGAGGRIQQVVYPDGGTKSIQYGLCRWITCHQFVRVHALRGGLGGLLGRPRSPGSAERTPAGGASWRRRGFWRVTGGPVTAAVSDMAHVVMRRAQACPRRGVRGGDAASLAWRLGYAARMSGGR